MKIFISWSGPHSRAIAEVLRTWLDDVFDAAEPFMSQSDILGGTRPLQRIEDELAGAQFGVIIVTAANQHAPWITFEAGALSKVIDDAVQYVMPLLVDLRISDLTGPLTQFQAAVLDAAGIKRMVVSVGHALGMEKATVERKFETYWPRLKEDLDEITVDADTTSAPARDRDEVVDEILTHVRALRQASNSAPILEAAALARRDLMFRNAGRHETFTLTGGGDVAWPDGSTEVHLDMVEYHAAFVAEQLGFGPVRISRYPGGYRLVFPFGTTQDEQSRFLLALQRRFHERMTFIALVDDPEDGEPGSADAAPV